MARPLRIEYEGAVYHVTSRGNAREAIFRDDQDRENILATIKKVRERYNWLCHAYCLMDNHYHLIIETPEGNLSQGMRQLNGVYSQMFNKKHKRAGMGGERIWKEVRGQSILGKEDFVESLIDYVKGYRDIKENTEEPEICRQTGA